MSILNFLVIVVLAVVFFLVAAFIFLIPVAFTLHSLITVAIVPIQLYRLAGSKKTRQNHALEHATINVLEEEGAHQHLAGLSDDGGFIIYGSSDLGRVKKSASAGLARLQRGERALAVNRDCGTGRGIVHLISALVFLFLLFLTGHFSFFYILAAFIISTSLGPLLGRTVQVYMTTSADLEGLNIEDVDLFSSENNSLFLPAEQGIRVKTSINAIEQR